MPSRRPLHATLALALLAALACLFARSARAAPPASPGAGPHHPVLAVSLAAGARAPLDLRPTAGVYEGEITIANDGDEPLAVSRLAIRGDDEDVRAPARLSVRFADGAPSSATIAPGASKRALVTWSPERSPRVRQVFAHVVVTSSDEQAGEVAMGVHAELASPLAWATQHLLSAITFAPLLGALVIVALGALGVGGAGAPRRTALVATGAQCVLAACALLLFRGDVGRLDGNDGLQLIEHAVWVRPLGAEYFLGVDGVSVALVVVTALVGFCGCLASEGVSTRERGYYALYLTLLSCWTGVFVAVDLLLFYALLAASILPAYLLVALWGGARKEYAAARLFFFMTASGVLLFLAIVALYVSSERTFLVDGAPTLHTFSIPELARVSFGGKHMTILGAPWTNVVWALLFVGFAVLVPAFPFHTWLPDVLAEAPAPVGALIAAVLTAVGPYGLLRVGLAILPDAARWAAGGLVAFGAIAVVYGALCAMAQDDARRLVAYATVAQMGFCLIGVGSLTPEGIAACLVQMTSHALVAAMLVLLVFAIEERARTRSLRSLGGLAGDMPLAAGLSGLALAAIAGPPGLSTFWGQGLALLGAFPLFRGLSAFAASGLVLAAACGVLAFRKIFLGTTPESLRASGALEPFGGRLPDLTSREIVTVLPFAVLVVLLGVWPVPLLALVSGGVRDLTSLVDPSGPDQIAALLHGASRALAMQP